MALRTEAAAHMSDKDKCSEGGKLILVPLGRDTKAYAMIERGDYAFLVRLGLSPNWNLSAKGYPTAGATRATGGRVSVARVLMDAGPGQTVRYRDSNPRNLRRENLELVKGGHALRRDREHLTPESIQRSKKLREVVFL